MKTNPTTALPTNTVPRLFTGVTRRLWSALLLLGALAAPPAAPAQASSRLDRILVKPRAGADLGALHARLGTTVRRTFPAIGGLQVVHLPAGAPAPMFVRLFQESGLVAYAEPDVSVRILAEPDDFRFWDGSLWAMKNTGQLGGTPGADIKAPQGWDLQTSAATVVVAVVDTGIRQTHEDLAGNLWTNPAEIAGNGLDDDGDGFVDDLHGINAITGGGDPADDHGHGSHVAGAIGATGNNAVGVAGVAWRVQLMALKFIDAQGNGAVSDAITCIDYARRHHARIINASWGGDPSYASAALRDAIASARTAGILFVAACGNSQGDNDTTPLYPASFNQQLDNVLAVASTNRHDGLSFFSNYGATTVDLAAPGEDIFSCWGGYDTDYRFDSGTSMAAAHVSGVAALVLARSGAASYAAVKQAILGSTDPLPGLQGKCATGGRLNLFRALEAAPPPPPPPLPPGNLAATATSASAIHLGWTDQSDNEQGFQIERAIGTAAFAPIAATGANATSFTDSGLEANTAYSYRVRAFNAAGGSAYSNTASATTPAAPPPPVPPTVTLAATDFTASESGDAGEFTFTRTGDPLAALTVYYLVGGTATNGVDYRLLSGAVTIPAGAASAGVRLVPINDPMLELPETVTVSVVAGPNYQIGLHSHATVLILDDDLRPPLR